MQRTLRGLGRFSDLGFTKSRMAWRLWVSAERETSAQTGRPFTVAGFFLVVIALPRTSILEHRRIRARITGNVRRERQQAKLHGECQRIGDVGVETEQVRGARRRMMGVDVSELTRVGQKPTAAYTSS